MRETIIVTGASGQFGSAAAELLLQRVPAQDLIFTSRKPEQLADFAARGAQIRFADFDRPETLATAFAGGARMLLISTARVGSRVGQHHNAIHAARAVGVGHVVYTSILGAAMPHNPAIVKLDHRATEEILEASGMAWTFLRDSQYAEAIATAMAPVALSTGRHYSAAGEGKIAVVSRNDCVECAVAVLTSSGHENRAYIPTGPALLTRREKMALIAELAGKPIELIDVDDAGMFAVFDALGIPRHASDDPITAPIPWCSTDMVSFDRAIREGIFDVLTDDVQRLTGHAPRSLREVMLENRSAWQPKER